jgi:DNA-binding transcriptional regulator YiaG
MDQPIDVKALRATLKLTQTELASQVGVAQGDVSNWENGKHSPSRAARKTLERLLELHRGQAA